MKTGTLNNSIYWELYNLAMNRISDDSVLSSIITFLEFANFDTRILKIDIQVAKKIIFNITNQ